MSVTVPPSAVGAVVAPPGSPTVRVSPSASVSLPSSWAAVNSRSVSWLVSTVSSTAVGALLKKVRWISRRAQVNSPSSSGGSAGALGPTGVINGANAVANIPVATLTKPPGSAASACTGPSSAASVVARGPHHRRW